MAASELCRGDVGRFVYTFPLFNRGDDYRKVVFDAETQAVCIARPIPAAPPMIPIICLRSIRLAPIGASMHCAQLPRILLPCGSLRQCLLSRLAVDKVARFLRYILFGWIQ